MKKILFVATALYFIGRYLSGYFDKRIEIPEMRK